jgi:hypothetical protein
MRTTVRTLGGSSDSELTKGRAPAKIQHTVAELEALVGREQWENVKDAAVRLRYLEGIDRAAKKWMDNH